MKFKFQLIRGGVVVSLILAFIIGVGHSQTTSEQRPIKAVVKISNYKCKQGVWISGLTFMKGSLPMAFKMIIPSAQIPMGASKSFSHEFKSKPTMVQIRGTVGKEEPLEITAYIGTTPYQCGSVTFTITGEVPPEWPPPEWPTPEEPQLPSELRGVTRGMGPQQIVNQLRVNGFVLEVKGSEARPKLSNVDDPLIVGALGPGFLTGIGYWVSGPGQLRSVVIWDQPSTTMILLVVSNFGNLCWSVPPPGGGGTVFCDRPAWLAPATTFGGGPVPGNVFLVLILKVGGPTQPFVLSLTG